MLSHLLLSRSNTRCHSNITRQVVPPKPLDQLRRGAGVQPEVFVRPLELAPCGSTPAATAG